MLTCNYLTIYNYSSPPRKRKCCNVVMKDSHYCPVHRSLILVSPLSRMASMDKVHEFLDTKITSLSRLIEPTSISQNFRTISIPSSIVDTSYLSLFQVQAKEITGRFLQYETEYNMNMHNFDKTRHDHMCDEIKDKKSASFCDCEHLELIYVNSEHETVRYVEFVNQILQDFDQILTTLYEKMIESATISQHIIEFTSELIQVNKELMVELG